MAIQPKRLKALIAHLEREGATVRETKSGYFVRPADPSKPTFSFHKDIGGNWRVEKNVRAEIERAGHTWPFSN